jgi:hypothetical protein
VCLWLGLDCVGQKDGRPKGWSDTDAIQYFVLKRSFDDPTEASIGDSIARFPPKFRAARLKDISGINIESTRYLDHHLRFNEYTRTLRVFLDAAWLQFMCNQLHEDCDSPQQEFVEAAGHGNSSNTVLPDNRSRLGVSVVRTHSQGTQTTGDCLGKSNGTSPGTKRGTSNEKGASGVR